MYSLHLKNLKEEQVKRSQKPAKPSGYTEKLAQFREFRIEKLAAETSPELLKIMKSGSVPYIHPSAIEYKEKPSKGSTFVKNYTPDKEKCRLIEKEFKDTHLEPGKYFKLREDYLRESSFPFQSEKRLSNSKHLEKGRVQLRAINNYGFMLDPQDYSHTFRDVDKEKWSSAKEFKSRVTGKDEFKSGLRSGDKYIDGYEVLGDVKRKRLKNLEISGDFKPNNTKGLWEKMFKYPGSSHTYTTRKLLEPHSPDQKWYPMSLKEFNRNSSP